MLNPSLQNYNNISDSGRLWNEYAQSPQLHRQIPDCSYAGYRYSGKPLPDVREVVNVRQSGAVGDGVTDDTLAFKRAIERAAFVGGGAIFVPEGSYVLSDILYFRHSGVVLRGTGRGRTTLLFAKPLANILGPLPYEIPPLRSQFAWCGGLIWIGPPVAAQAPAWEEWRERERLAALTRPARQGDTVVEVDPVGAARLKPGMTVLKTWDNPPDHSLLNAVAGHERMRETDWATDGRMLAERPNWHWPVEIAAVDGTSVTLKQPMRLDARESWNVRFGALGPHVEEVGVEHLTIRMLHNDGKYVHLQDECHNGIYLNRALHCWVRDVTVENAQNGILHAAAKNTTVTGLVIAGRSHHHSTVMRLYSHDNLITDFRIEAQPVHGINTEGMSSGNVWRRGEMLHGTFDSHRQMSFDSIRTDITVYNDGSPGGSAGFGPFLGRRMTHWNILQGIS
ncbi:MAG: hypothetical protein K0R28_15 [Paenibacillus sp.]|jgi:hypothetical protein|nr:hypothetical protein [Paenibacillus sp.]